MPLLETIWDRTCAIVGKRVSYKCLSLIVWVRIPVWLPIFYIAMEESGYPRFPRKEKNVGSNPTRYTILIGSEVAIVCATTVCKTVPFG
jgi:hypothetical protein